MIILKSLYDYDLLVNDVFYRCYHILEYIEKHPNMDELEKDAIKATIMDALVYKKEINPNKESLDFDNLCIVDNLDYYTYEKHPNICGIPLWMKEELRKKRLFITGGIPISMNLAKPPSKLSRYCVYDPNTAVSSIFDDATFYNCYYDSPTRKGIRINEVRPFVEVKINNELYLVDTLTKRILKSNWFKEKYNFEVRDQQTISKMDEEKLDCYKFQTRYHNSLANFLLCTIPILNMLNEPNFDEMRYEVEQCKIYFPNEWEEYKLMEDELKKGGIPDISKFIKKK